MARPLGRRIPTDWNHYENFRFTIPRAVETVEILLPLPRWHWLHDQGHEGACVGYGTAMERAITNNLQVNAFGRYWARERWYDPRWIWNEAKKVDEWPDTNPGDDNGTSVRAGYDVMRDQGPVRCLNYTTNVQVPTWGSRSRPLQGEGANVNRWANKVDELRTSLANKIPVTIGVNWYSNFDHPQPVAAETTAIGNIPTHKIGDGQLGNIRGGHCVCLYGASDKQQAFAVKNSWGSGYPLIWLPYDVMQRLIDEDGEATVVTDR